MSDQPAADRPVRRVSIGPLLRALEPDFPGITASKIRFLEDQGLVHPERTASGYRKYSSQDLERLQAVLRLQREHYMPLKVIRELADAGRLLDFQDPAAPVVSKDCEPAESSEQQQSDVPSSGSMLSRRSEHSLTMRELCLRSGAGVALVRELLNFGLIRDGEGHFDSHDIAVAAAARELQAFGVEPRHLRTLRQAADRETGLVEQAVATEATRRTQESARRAAQRAEEIAGLCLSMHAALVSSRLEQLQRGIAPEEPSQG